IQLGLRLELEDSAGNIGYTLHSAAPGGFDYTSFDASYFYILELDQNSDRPIISLNNVDTDGSTTLKLTKTLYGTVSDDDDILLLEVKSLVGDSYDTVSLNGNSWNYDIPGSDGSKNLYFRITDVGSDGVVGGGDDKIFETTEASSEDKPRIESGVATYVETPIALTVDTVTPEIYSNINVDRAAPFDFAATELVITGMAFGGNSSSFALDIWARDANGIASVVVNIPTVGDVGATYFDTHGSGYDRWRTSDIDITAVSDGPDEFTFTVTDNSGLVSTATRSIVIDNTAPEVTHLSPRSLVDVVNGDVDIKGLASDSGSGLASVQYKIGYNHALYSWQDVDDPASLFNWEVSLSGANKIDGYAGQEADSVDDSTDEITLTAHGLGPDMPVWVGADVLPGGLDSTTTYYIRYVGINTVQLLSSPSGSVVNLTSPGTALRISSYAKDPNNDLVWDLPILFRAVDEAGNEYLEDETDYIVKVDPSGDKPRATVVYPDPLGVWNSDLGVYETVIMGGVIRIFGTAADDDAVQDVYMQIDVNNDGLFNSSDVDSELVDWYTGGNGQLVTGTYSWNKTINSNGEFNPAEIGVASIIDNESYVITSFGTTDFVALHGAADNNVGTEFTATQDGIGADGTGLVEPLTNTISFRARVRDIYGTYGPWTEVQEIIVDKNVPKIGSSDPLVLENQADNSITMSYVQDIWIKDDWTLTGTVEDESGISDIVIAGDINGTLAGNPSWFTSFDSGSGSTGYTMAIDVNTIAGNTGTIEFSIKAYDNNEPKMSSTSNISINYDNQAPTNTAYAGNLPVEQSNRTYELTSTVNESGSGLERVAIYFKRPGGTTDPLPRVYNPMEDNTANANRTYLSTLTMVDGLPRLAISGGTRSDDYTLKHASIEGNDNVRIGGLIKIGGIDRLITAVDTSAGVGTVQWADAVDVSFTDADIAYAVIVDNTNIETPEWTGEILTDINNDDGDWLIESIEKAGGSYLWSASL
ncbi:MAG: hypothetical protein PF495_17445, partial [Spirochaetales bacterium]|nr:hypothetical protein [Spirochaetales bacterium]